MTNIYLSDQPVKSKNHDKFNRYNFSKRIAQTIINRSDSSGITVGIYGQWGEGKTSVLNFIEEELKRYNGILILNFNPWRYTDEESLLRGFLEKVANLIGYELNTQKEKIGNFLSKYGKIGSLFGYDVSTLGKAISEADVETLKMRVNDVLRSSKSKLVIIVDDIDRLDKNEIFSLFRLVKLTGNFEKTTYILSFDEKMVANAIGERFGENRDSGSNFLEKIIQVPLKIPQVQKSTLNSYFLSLLDKAIEDNKIDIDKSQVVDFTTQFNESILLRLYTPRLAVRYCNVLSFSLPLLEGEVNLVDLMLIEALKIFYPEHYEFVKNNPFLFLASYKTDYGINRNEVTERKKELTEGLTKLEEGLTKKEKEAVKNLLERLFPRLTEVFYNSFWEQATKKWIKEKRIGSGQYFNRYFSYSLSDDEISDTAFEEVLKIMKNDDDENKDEILGNFINRIGLNEFVYKINLYDSDIDWKTTKKIITALVRISDGFSDIADNDNFGISTETNQVTFLIHHFLKLNNNQPDVFEFFKSLFYISELNFAFTLEYFVRTGRKENDKLFSEAENDEITRILRDIVLSKTSENKPIFKVAADNLEFLLSTWHKDNALELREYFSVLFTQTPEYVKEFLIAFVSTIKSITQQKSFKADLRANDFEVLKTTLDIDLIYNIIISNYSVEIQAEDVKFFNSKEGQTEINILRQYIYWYENQTAN